MFLEESLVEDGCLVAHIQEELLQAQAQDDLGQSDVADDAAPEFGVLSDLEVLWLERMVEHLCDDQVQDGITQELRSLVVETERVHPDFVLAFH